MRIKGKWKAYLIFLCCVLAAHGGSPERVILIQADDLGFGDIGVHGNVLVDTPHLDRLAGESVQLRDFTVNPVCAPSRATLMTGRHFLRTGVSHVHGGKDYLNLDEVTLGERFAAAGWQTGYWGKWHLGTEPGYEPWDRGFGVARRLQLYRHANAIYRTEGAGGAVEEHATDRWADAWLVDEAIAFLEAHRGEKAFLYLASMTPHGPLAAPAPFVRPYRERGLSPNLATHFGMISYLDHQLGRLLAYLEETGQAADTLLVFTSDNGPAISRHLFSDADRQLRKAGGLRGWKGDIWQGGVRVPCFVRWPAELEPAVVLNPIDQTDVLPTLLDLCGIPPGDAGKPLDGVSQTEALRGSGKAQLVEAPIFNWSHPGWITGPRPYDPKGIADEYNPVRGTLGAEPIPFVSPAGQSMSVRLGRYKLVRNQDQPDIRGNRPWRSWLIDLWADPGEAVDLSRELPDKRAELDALLDAWFQEILADPGSFGHPVLRVKPNADRVFDAKLVMDVKGGLQNSVIGLFGWTGAGQRAFYELEMAEPMRRRLRLEWNTPPAPGTKLAAVVQGSDRWIPLSAETEWTTEAALVLPAGRQVLFLQVTETGVGEREARLDTLRLIAD